MSQNVKVYRTLELERGGTKDNQAAPAILIRAQNKSGDAVARGDVVVWDKTANTTGDVWAFTTTTNAKNVDVLGMVYDSSIANNAFGRVQIWGPTDALKVDGTANIAIGDYLATHTVAKIAAKTTAGGAFARAAEAYETNDSSGVIDAYIQAMSSPLPAASVTALADAASLAFGDGSDVTIQWDGTDMHIAVAADDSVINIGDGTSSADLVVYGDAATDTLTWDASAKTLHVTDGSKVGFGNTSATPDISINWDGTDLHVAGAAANSIINVGDANQLDLNIIGNTTDDTVYWDGSGNVLNLSDGVKLGFGNTAATPDVTIQWDGTDMHVMPAADDTVINFGDGTSSVDLIVYGNNATDNITFDASANNLDLNGAVDLRINNIGTLDFPASAAGQTTFSVSGLTSNDLVILTPREGTQGVLVVDKVQADQLTIRNTASETSNVECNYYVLAKG